MSRLAMVLVVGLLGLACTESARDEQDAVDGSVAGLSQFLASCTESCPEPLSCTCGVCTLACTSDEPCLQYSSNATCVSPAVGSECESVERSCDVPCTHDAICERLDAEYKCLVGRCRHQVVDAGSQDAGFPECPVRTAVAVLCALPLEGPGTFNNEGTPLQGTIVAMGEAEARPECLGSDNFGAAIPVATPAGEQPEIPEGTSWWRVDDGTTVYTVGVAAPGLDALGVAVGDGIVIRHAVSWGGWYGPRGNAQIEIAGRGHVLIAINDSSLLDVSDGPADCLRPGPCGGQEWSMLIDVDGEQISVAPFESVQVGSSLFTNAGALTHHPEYVEPNEETEGTPGCKGELRTSFVATRVDTL